MEKAVRKKVEREKAKASRSSSNALNNAAVKSTETASPETPRIGTETSMLSDAEQSKSHEISPAESYLKRKRDGDDSPNSPKKSKLEEAPTPPPPPPPPPADDMLGPDGTALTPQEEESSSLLSLSDKDANTVALNGKPRLPQDDVMQLATPPTNGSTNGSSEHNVYSDDRSSTKH
jgi:histone-lysine N-methyltransferase SETD2